MRKIGHVGRNDLITPSCPAAHHQRPWPATSGRWCNPGHEVVIKSLPLTWPALQGTAASHRRTWSAAINPLSSTALQRRMLQLPRSCAGASQGIPPATLGWRATSRGKPDGRLRRQAVRASPRATRTPPPCQSLHCRLRPRVPRPTRTSPRTAQMSIPCPRGRPRPPPPAASPLHLELSRGGQRPGACGGALFCPDRLDPSTCEGCG